ncbi:MAG TPA: site-2 protease family protein [Actinomycetota bacterium]|nr:site-2 protease family protein [Actinomycetota bacterium]
MTFDPITALFMAIAYVPAFLLHELSHGWLAVRFGDPSPRFRGRLTLNPRPHIEAFGTVVVPALLLLPVLFGRGGIVFGYARPMPINRASLPRPDRDMTLIALGGIATNLVLGVLGAVAFRFTRGGLLGNFFYVWTVVNIAMAVIHIVPVPPLDGSRILAPLLPPRARAVYESWEPYGALFVLALLFLLPVPILGIAVAVADGLNQLLLG